MSRSSGRGQASCRVIGQGRGDSPDHGFEVLEVVALVLSGSFAFRKEPSAFHDGLISVFLHILCQVLVKRGFKHRGQPESQLGMKEVL
jgi:hypothetical protein